MTRKIKKIITEDIDVGMDDFLETADRVGHERVTIRENGQPVDVPLHEVTIRKLGQEAAKGGAHALRQWHELQHNASRAKKQEHEENVAYWTKVKQTNAVLYESHRQTHGCDPIDVYPHPDDIVPCHQQGVRIIGPVDKAAYDAMLRTKRIMETLLMQNALDVRAKTKQEAEGPTTALLLYVQLQKGLPERERLTDSALTTKIMRYQTKTKRDLEREVFQAWRALGFNLKRGALSVPADVTIEYLKRLYAMSHIIRDKGLSDHRRNALLADWKEDFAEFVLRQNVRKKGEVDPRR